MPGIFAIDARSPPPSARMMSRLLAINAHGDGIRVTGERLTKLD